MTAVFRRIVAFFLSLMTCLSALFGGTRVTPWRLNDTPAVDNDIADDSNLADSVLLASKLANGVQCVYANAKRTAYQMTNRDMTLTHTLGKNGNGVHYNPDGTYCYSFVYDSDGSPRTFRATVE